MELILRLRSVKFLAQPKAMCRSTVSLVQQPCSIILPILLRPVLSVAIYEANATLISFFIIYKSINLKTANLSPRIGPKNLIGDDRIPRLAPSVVPLQHDHHCHVIRIIKSIFT